MERKQAVSIEKMIDEVFDQNIDNDLIDELAESQTLLRNFLTKTVNDNELWQQLAERNNVNERKQLLELIAITFLETDINLSTIDMITSNNIGEKK
jgi:hypothetical protein